MTSDIILHTTHVLQLHTAGQSGQNGNVTSPAVQEPNRAPENAYASPVPSVLEQTTKRAAATRSARVRTMIFLRLAYMK